MLVLESAEDCGKLEKLLGLSVPESLKVYGAVFFINRGNLFNMEVLVDSWPNFKTVISKPKSTEMVDNLDFYRNVYFIFTKDPENLRKMLQTSEVINWNQCFQIQALQRCIADVIVSIAKSKRVAVKRYQLLLFVRDIHMGDSEKKPTVSSDKMPAVQSSHQLNVRGEQPPFPLSQLKDADAELVNANWVQGGNHGSLKFVQQCIRLFPNICILGPGGKPISWIVMSQASEMRMAYTVPEYRHRGLVIRLLESFMAALCTQQEDFPFYTITEEHNVQAQGAVRKAGLWNAPCGAIQLFCCPLKSTL